MDLFIFKKKFMQHSSSSSIIRGIGYLFLLILLVNCKKDEHLANSSRPDESISELNNSNLTATALNLFQTRTATLFNYNLAGNLVTNFSKTSKAGNVAFDDGVYASTIKLTARNGYSLLVLEGFNFNIPGDATIQNIWVKARRFKTGTCGIWEVNASLVMKRERADLPDWWDQYGARWADPNYFPITETEVNYSQSGSGTRANGQLYQWTPARINDPYFGVLFQTASVENSKGSAVINYDLVEITVEYAIP
jgi:hypothetical protein